MVFSEFSSRPRPAPPGVFALLLLALCVICLPSRAAPAQSRDYTIGSHDVLTVVVWEHTDLSGKFSVEADGTIGFPLIGRTRVGGLTVQLAEQALQKLLSNGYVKNPQVSIVVEQYRSQQIFVIGEVKSPGGYPFTGELTLLEALAKAGGATDRAGSVVVLVRPADSAQVSGPVLPDAQGEASQVTRIDLEELQRKGSVGALELRPRDTIFVPKAETVFVFGQVIRPGEYPIRSGTTVLQALSLAGGVTERGSTRRIQVVRVLDGRETKLDIKPHEIVQPGDTIVVRERFF